MPCNRVDVIRPERSLSEKQRLVFFELCTRFLKQLRDETTYDDWDCVAGLVDRLVKASHRHTMAAGALAHLSLEEVREIQTRFAESVYASFNLAPPSLEPHERGDNPLKIRCLFCNGLHEIPSL